MSPLVQLLVSLGIGVQVGVDITLALIVKRHGEALWSIFDTFEDS